MKTVNWVFVRAGAAFLVVLYAHTLASGEILPLMGAESSSSVTYTYEQVVHLLRSSAQQLSQDLGIQAAPEDIAFVQELLAAADQHQSSFSELDREAYTIVLNWYTDHSTRAPRVDAPPSQPYLNVNPELFNYRDLYLRNLVVTGSLIAPNIINNNTNLVATGTPANIPNTLVLRDGTGSFAAQNITAATIETCSIVSTCTYLLIQIPAASGNTYQLYIQPDESIQPSLELAVASPVVPDISMELLLHGNSALYARSDSVIEPFFSGMNVEGDPRGDGAVDLQLYRNNMAQVASGSLSSLLGGIDNIASGFASTVIGGEFNSATSLESIVAGGQFNSATGPRSGTFAGQFNSATGAYSTVLGGVANNATADYSLVPGGLSNTASGIASFAAGQNAHAVDDNSFVWADGSTTFTSQGPQTFNVLATGGSFFDSDIITNASLTFVAPNTNTVTLFPSASTASYPLQLPPNAGTLNYVLTTDGTGITSWAPVTVVGGTGITQLNGLITSTQFFAVGTAGTAFNIVSAGNTHTFNLPLASTLTVTAGTISNIDYMNFYNTYTTVLAGTPLDIPTTLVLRDNTGSFVATTVTVTGGIAFVALDSNVVTMVPDPGTTSYTLQLPPNTGTPNYVLTTDGSGITSWQSVSAAGGGGIIDLNGLTTSTQFFANGYAGLQPQFVSLGNTHTLNIPLASTYGVLAGLITSTDYVNFQNTYTTVLAATPLDIPNTLVKRDNTGSFVATTVTVTGGVIFISPDNNTVALLPSSTTVSYTLQLPPNSGTANYVLTTDGTGITSWQSVSAAGGGGIIDLNGLTTSTQFFANGYAGLQPQFVSLGSTHTLNIPLASTYGVLAGLITSTDYVNFQNTYTTVLAATPLDIPNTLVKRDNTGSFVATTVTITGGVILISPDNNTVTLLPSSTTVSYTLQLPPNAGTANYVLTTDGTGVTSWQPSTGGGGGSGITDLNGLTTSTQFFANGYAGVQPQFVSLGNTHTLNIPLASSYGVLAGLITSTDYFNFENTYTTVLAGTPLNIPNTLVKRDGTGSFAAQNITAATIETCSIVSTCTYLLIQIPDATGVPYQLVIEPDSSVQSGLQFALRSPVPDVSLELILQGSGAFYAWNSTSDETFLLPIVSGDPRGAYAIDLQTVRVDPTCVASGLTSALVGGSNNSATANASSVFAGTANQAQGIASTIVGGQVNRVDVDGQEGGILAGYENYVNGLRAVAVGGANNRALGEASFAAGTLANALHDYSFVWADNSIGYNSHGENTFNVHAAGGAYFDSNITTTHALIFAAPNGNKLTLLPNPATASYTLQFPPTSGTNGYVLTTDGIGVTSWAPGGGGVVTTGTSANIPNTLVLRDDTGSFAAQNITAATIETCSIVSTCTYLLMQVADATGVPYQLVIEPDSSIQPGMQLALRSPAPDVSLELILQGSGALYVYNKTDDPSFLLPVVTGTTRGAYAVDLQTVRVQPEFVASGVVSALVGGSNNLAAGEGSSVLAGAANQVYGLAGTILGGQVNTVDTGGQEGAILAGFENYVDGARAVVVGGNNNTAIGINSFAAGTRASAASDYSFVWSDNNGGYSSHADNTFNVRALGGAYFDANITTTGAVIFEKNSNTVTLQPNPSTAAYTFQLPPDGGTTNYVLTTAGAGVTSWQPVSAIGASGITQLNGLITSTQFFAVGAVGTGFNIVSAGNTHTFNIPLASTLTVTAGLLSNTDYTNFNNTYTTVLAGTPLDVSNTLVKRDGTGSFVATNITATGAVKFVATNSNVVTMQPSASTNTYTFQLPANTGTNNYVLATDGTGVTSWQPVSAVAQGILQLNGLTTSTQFFANGFAGVQPQFVSSVNTHTLNIPLSSTFGVLAGLITSTDYFNFRNTYTTVLASTSLNVPNTLVLRNNRGSFAATAVTVTGGVVFQASNGNTVSMLPNSLTASYTFQLPINAGTNNYVLTTNGAGVTSWQPTVAAGITTLNGLTTSTQFFANGFAGVQPQFVSLGTTHTLNIPLASTFGVLAGLITSTDYFNFRNTYTTVLAGTSLNIPNTLVKRDGTGSFAAQNIAAATLQTCSIVSTCTYLLIQIGNPYQLSLQQNRSIQPTFEFAVNGSVPTISFDFVTHGTGAFYVRSDASLFSEGEGLVPNIPGSMRGEVAIDLQMYRSDPSNVASGIESALLGGASNTASGTASAVIVGTSNIASGNTSVVAGGFGNIASSSRSVVLGGSGNLASGAGAAVIGASGSTASNIFSAVIGSLNSVSDGSAGVVVGGDSNMVSGINSVIFGGSNNVAIGGNAVAAGSKAVALHNNTFVWADGTQTFTSQATKTFNILATGGSFFNSNITTTGVVRFAAPNGNILTLKSSTTTNTYTFQLPPNPGTNGYVLTTDGTGVTSWQQTSSAVSYGCTLSIDTANQAVGIGVCNPAIYSYGTVIETLGTATWFGANGGFLTPSANSILSGTGSSFSLNVSGSRAYIFGGIGTAYVQAFDANQQCVMSPVYTTSSIAMSSGPLQSATVGGINYLYGASSTGLGTLIRFNLSTNPLVNDIQTNLNSFVPVSIAAANTDVYTVNAGTPKLSIYDFDWTFLGSTSSGLTTPIKIQVVGNTAFVIDAGSSTLRSYNITNPAAPAALTSTAIGAVPVDMIISSSRAYITNQTAPGTNSLKIYDVSNPSVSMPILGTKVLNIGNIGPLAVSGNFAIVSINSVPTISGGTSTGALYLIDATTPSNMPIKTIDAGYEYTIQQLALNSNKLYAVGTSGASGSPSFLFAYNLQPSFALTVTGNVMVQGSIDIVPSAVPTGASCYGQLKIAGTPVLRTSNDQTGIFVGQNAGSGTPLTASYNVAVGPGSMEGAISGSGNTVIGALTQNIQGVSANGTVVVGYLAQAPATSAIAIGNQAVAGANSAIALGVNSNQATTAGTSSIAVGNTAKAAGSSSIAIGNTANIAASSTDAIAIGTNTNLATTAGTSSLALGNSAKSAGTSGIAIGLSSNALSGQSIAIGQAAAANAGSAVAIGINTISGNLSSLAVGDSAQAVGLAGVALGSNSNAGGNAGLAVGNLANASAPQGIAIGLNALANGSSQAIAIGVNSNQSITAGISSIALGSAATAAGAAGIAFGPSATASAIAAIAIGNLASASSSNAIAIGGGANSATTAGISSVALGDTAKAGGAFGIAIGSTSLASTSSAVAIGVAANASGGGSISLGSRASSAAPNAIAIGTNTNLLTTAGASSIALGNTAKAAGISGIAIGFTSLASTTSAVAIGGGASASGSVSIALGADASSTVANAIAIGTGAQSTGSSAIAAGNGTLALSADAIALGRSAQAGPQSISVGALSTVVSNSSVGIGYQTQAFTQATALGYQTTATTSATAIGYQANAGLQSISVGALSNASGSSATGVGYQTTAASGAVAIGYTANAGSTNAIAMGINTNSAITPGASSIALGDTAIASGLSAIAIGKSALAATRSVAIGDSALLNATSGNSNVAIGDSAGRGITSGTFNVCVGPISGGGVITGANNILIGSGAASSSVIPSNDNVFIGTFAGTLSTTLSGSTNVVIGTRSGQKVSAGSRNIIIGNRAGTELTTGSNNIFVGEGAGVTAGSPIISGSNNVIIGTGFRNSGPVIASSTGVTLLGSGPLNMLGNPATTYMTGVFFGINGSASAPISINSVGQLGTAASSRKFKENIKDIGSDSSAIMQLRPVSFKFKGETDDFKNYGLIAEEVYEVMPELVLLDDNKEPWNVSYQHLHALMLNEMQKHHKFILDLQQQNSEMAKRIGELETQLTQK